MAFWDVNLLGGVSDLATAIYNFFIDAGFLIQLIFLTATFFIIQIAIILVYWKLFGFLFRIVPQFEYWIRRLAGMFE